MRYLWYAMYAFVGALAIYSLFFTPDHGRRHHSPEPTVLVDPEPVVVNGAAADVQIALLLDTSSSMDGLIEQARTQLWEIVGELQTDGKDQDRKVMVALYQYGNSRLDKRTGFIEKLSNLTSELDGVSVKLHSLSTSGGKEYAPLAISRAVNELSWSDEDDVEKVIVIAGNEGFSQGSLSSEDATAQAAAKGIKIIPIFCANGGATSTGLASWQRAAKIAGAKLDTIDPDKVVAKIETEYDAEIVRKYRELEDTGLTYGTATYRDEVAQYKTAAGSYAAAAPVALQAERAVIQARQARSNDLVADYGKSVSLDKIDVTALPAPLQKLSPSGRVKEIEARRVRRAAIESEIQSLSAKREAKLQTVPAYSSESSAPSLGSSVRAQLR